jgi:hypothetical protein
VAVVPAVAAWEWEAGGPATLREEGKRF